MTTSNNRLRFAYFVLVVCMTVTALAGVGESPAFEISWHTLDAGGGVSAGASLQMHSTIGQHDASPGPLTGGPFTVVGGFWPAAGDATPSGQADPNSDGLVNIDDLLLVINNWNNTGPNIGDLNGSGTVDIDDLLIVINGWGICP
jgi:hypothetical protein